MNKRKIFSLALTLCMVAILAIGGTLAYFTDTDSATNVFTVGSVEIDLTEVKTATDQNGNLVAVPDESRNDVGDDEQEKYDYGKVYPGQYIVKDPTITRDSEEDAYLAAIVTITSAGDLHSVIGSSVVGSPYINVATPVELERGGASMQVISGGLAEKEATWTNDWMSHGHEAFVANDGSYTVIQKAHNPNEGEGSEYVMYFFITDPTVDKVTLFERLNFDWKWDNEEMAAFKDMEIKVDAYAVQAYGFYGSMDAEGNATVNADDCFVAMTTAFPEAFAELLPQE